ncbi:MAG: hypothetical protein U0Y08_07245 [Bacteroidia bacterium]
MRSIALPEITNLLIDTLLFSCTVWLPLPSLMFTVSLVLGTPDGDQLLEVVHAELVLPVQV